MSGGGRKVLLPPINFIFKLLQQHSTVQIWLYEQLGIRIEGKIRGFDEFMNLVRASDRRRERCDRTGGHMLTDVQVIDEAVEVKQQMKGQPEPESPRRELGQILLKGDNVCLIQALN